MSGPPVFECPLRNTCERTVTAGPGCGTVPEHLPALPLAEAMCVSALRGRIETLEATPDEVYAGDRARRLVSIPWLKAELALTPHVDDGTAKKLLSKAGAEAAALLDDSSLDFPAYTEAAMLDIHLEALQRRRQRLPFSLQMLNAREGIADLIAEARQAEVHNHNLTADFSVRDHQPCFRLETDRESLLARLYVQELMLTSGRVLFPASTRESDYRANPYTYHHFYGIEQGTKLPLRAIGTHGRSDPNVCSVSWPACVGIVRGSTPVLRATPRDEVADLLSDWVIAKAEGQQITTAPARAVATAINYTKTQVRNFRDNLNRR